MAPEAILTTSPIPFMNLGLMHAEISAEVDEGFARIMATSAYVGGGDVGAFETEFAAYSGRAHCVGTANGTDAIELGLRALGLGAGDEVILPANTFVATAEAVRRAGAVPVVCDVTVDTLLMDVSAAEAAITSRTKALLPVHLFGQMAPMAAIQELAGRHSLMVIEDAAQAQGDTQGGAGVGAGSACATTSFYPGKNLGAYGDAGAVVCDDPQIADRVRRIGNHGSDRKYVHDEFGVNSRLDTMQAVVLRAKLRRLDAWNAQRREAADRYSALLDGSAVVRPVTGAGNEHVWHLYVVRVPDRDSVAETLAAEGIGVGIHYPVPVHCQPAFADAASSGACPVVERAAGEILSLPMFPGITAVQQERVAAALLRAVG
jgi:dTDP-4-amino-4,6-dideoxygalactose transaminase